MDVIIESSSQETPVTSGEFACQMKTATETIDKQLERLLDLTRALWQNLIGPREEANNPGQIFSRISSSKTETSGSSHK